MHKEMKPVVVAADGEDIFIRQGNGDDEDGLIIVTPEQVALLVLWLQEARSRAEQHQTERGE